jgi:predicted transglutaminase-like cysteine proteinase
MRRYCVKSPESGVKRRLLPLAAIPVLMALGACSQQGGRPSLGAAAAPPMHGIAGDAMEDGGITLAPQGWLDYCARTNKDPSCRAALLTPARAIQLQEVQAAIRKIPSKTDVQLFRVAEYWNVADETIGGDCEDIALAARQRLLALGWPLSALRLATAWTEHNEYHLVLTVDVFFNNAVETLVIDSRYARVQTYSALLAIGYRFNTRQAANGAVWVKIEAPSLSRLEMASLRKQAQSPATSAIGAPAKLAVDDAVFKTVDANAGQAAATAPTREPGAATVTDSETAVLAGSCTLFASDQPFGAGQQFGPVAYFN